MLTAGVLAASAIDYFRSQQVRYVVVDPSWLTTEREDALYYAGGGVL